MVTQPARPPRLLRNDQALGNQWLRITLQQEGDNRDAIGARVTLNADNQSQYRYLTPAKSYLSHVEFPLTFGLGAASSAQVEVTWPDGASSRFGPLAAGQTHVLTRKQ